MRIFIKASLLTGLICFSSLQADEYITNNPYMQNQTNTMAFVVQSAAIAGAARACGMDISVFVNHMSDALNKLSLSSSDKVLAAANFQTMLRQSEDVQANTARLPCAQVIADFKNLPLMSANYQQNIQSLNPAQGRANNQPPPGPPYASPVTSSVSNPPPNINSIANRNPLPPTPVDSNARNILFQDPSVAPRVNPTDASYAPNIIYLAPNPFTNQKPPLSVSNPYAGKIPGP